MWRYNIQCDTFRLFWDRASRTPSLFLGHRV
jgi:hypothetical protein